MKYLAVVLLGLVLSMRASAHDHQDPSLNPWMVKLHAGKDGKGAWCCKGDDVEQDVEWRGGKDGYEVKLDGEWVQVPDEAMVEGPNKAGMPLVWKKYVDGHPAVRCFMPGGGL